MTPGDEIEILHSEGNGSLVIPSFQSDDSVAMNPADDEPSIIQELPDAADADADYHDRAEA
eukprot:CAMPEP_0183741290 /NCGR_PEP_ID=MMETSP0737-20130205/61767_1 /TAXON_ID=385413 /ORGANISM="Thalassiosira miniscula, Strain CCMP1093" /LENGTH=60 /DNA_ID=CAMNT_0025976577 /DNA_START=20 /DNA_END=198 /DNA_ORIENTATION=+